MNATARHVVCGARSSGERSSEGAWSKMMRTFFAPASMALSTIRRAALAVVPVATLALRFHPPAAPLKQREAVTNWEGGET